MYVIAGKHRGRRIEAPEGKAVRPTASRTREAVFNILSHGRYAGETPLLQGRIADIFCGSGAMGLEAFSRGATSVTFVDKSRDSLEAAEYNLKHFGEDKRAKLIRADSSILPPAPHPHEIVFIDPPYRSGLAIPALNTALKGGWLAPEGVAVVEQAWKEPVTIPEGWQQIDDRKYGNTRILLLELAQ
jgi:16S rRNA (guanine966-N2)-methyltransferase